jgi:hypothetical protein
VSAARADANRQWVVLAVVAGALVPAVSLAGCLGPKWAPEGTAAWAADDVGIVEVGERLYHYRTVYYPEPDTLNPQEDGYEVIFRDVDFYLVLVSCAVVGDWGSCALRAAIFLLDLVYEETVEPPQGLADGVGQVYLEEGGVAGLLWQGGQAIRLLVEA